MLAKHQCGSRTIERVIGHNILGEIEFVYTALVSQAPLLVGHEYGNYVVQHLLFHGDQFLRRR